MERPLFPLVLTQSDSTKVVTLGLYNFQTAHGIDIPGLLGAVVLSTLVPILLVYLFARRALVQGLMGDRRKVIADVAVETTPEVPLWNDPAHLSPPGCPR